MPTWWTTSLISISTTRVFSSSMPATTPGEIAVLHDDQWLENYIVRCLREIDVDETTAAETAQQMTRDLVAAFDRLHRLEAQCEGIS